MMRKTLLTLVLGVASLLALATPGKASEPCATDTLSESAAFLATLQLPPALTEAQPGQPALPAGEVVPKATFCTKEQCSIARQECRAWCPFPCAMTFQCVTPDCGSCISCSC